MIRAFLAVELSHSLLAALAILQQELKRRIEPELKRGARISWAQPTSVHLTLKFLGDMDEQAIGRLGPVMVPLERLGTFPPSRQSSCIVGQAIGAMGKGGQAKRVAEIYGAIEQACEGLRFLRETRPFSPHLTLARIKMGEQQVGLSLAKSGLLDLPLSLGQLAMDRVILMQSALPSTGIGLF